MSVVLDCNTKLGHWLWVFCLGEAFPLFLVDRLYSRTTAWAVCVGVVSGISWTGVSTELTECREMFDWLEVDTLDSGGDGFIRWSSCLGTCVVLLSSDTLRGSVGRKHCSTSTEIGFHAPEETDFFCMIEKSWSWSETIFCLSGVARGQLSLTMNFVSTTFVRGDMVVDLWANGDAWTVFRMIFLPIASVPMTRCWSFEMSLEPPFFM